jgi:guanylate kinase
MSSRKAPNLVVVSAPSGAGKSTVLGRVLRELTGMRFSVSHTTRPSRPGEREGVQYHFVDRPRFEELVRDGRLLEWARVHDHLYGTSRGEYERAESEGVDLLLDLDVQGAAQVRAQFPDALSIFILPPSYGELEKRLRGRGESDEAQVRRRLEAARAEVRRYQDYDYAVVNDDLDRCVEAVRSVIQAARCRTRRMDGMARSILETFEAGASAFNKEVLDE